MKIKIWTVTTEGDNAPMETSVFASEDQVLAHMTEVLETYGVMNWISARDQKEPECS